LISAVIIGLDQLTKALVRVKIPLGTDWLPGGLMWLLPYARIRHWYNSGAAFGIFQNGNLVFTILAITIILLILYYFPRTERNDWWLRVAMIMQFAGAAGNLLDRLAFAHVTDFISVGNFAIFNVADASISTGVAVLLLGVWLKERAEKKRASKIALPGDEQHVPGEDEDHLPIEDEAKRE
jgi:signal peptidase II